MYSIINIGVIFLNIFEWSKVNLIYREYIWDSRIVIYCRFVREYIGFRLDRLRWYSLLLYSFCFCSFSYSYSCSYFRSLDRWYYFYRGFFFYIYRSLFYSSGLVCYRKVYYCIVSFYIRKFYILIVFNDFLN